jgi:hypothetical protein
MNKAEKVTIIIIDDDKKHRDNLTWNLKNGFGYDVMDYRDLKTFKVDMENLYFKAKEKLLFILDIMFAQELDTDADDAPVLTHKNLSIEEKKRFREDDLGLRLATDIREGDYENFGINPNVPIIFFTCRQNIDVVASIKALNASYLTKPQPLYNIQNEIEQFVITNI